MLDKSELEHPKPNSGMPGAQTIEETPPEMERRVVTIYLDLNGQLWLSFSTVVLNSRN